METYDVVLLTASEYINPPTIDDYIQNVLTEDQLVQTALENHGLKVARVGWDDVNFNWSSTKNVLIRAIWDYFERYEVFEPSLRNIASQTKIINPIELIWWNIDKHYLADLEKSGVNIVPTQFIEIGDKRTLREILKEFDWEHSILKPAISGAARHTYKLSADNIQQYENTFAQLIAKEAMLIQPFMENILKQGEVSHMVFDGKYSHSILKKAKLGDFRVQDDFGGSVHLYTAADAEVTFAENVTNSCKVKPLYARVDVVIDNKNQLALSELELIEPELWFRHQPAAATDLCNGFVKFINN